MTKSSIENDTNQVVTYIRDGDKIGVSVFLRKGGDPNTRNNMGWTLLHLACLEGRAEIAEILLDAGAMVNCCTTDMCTPLHLASARGNKKAVEVLVAKGAYINAQDKAGNTPLHEAAKAFHTPIVEYLIEKKADRNRMNKKNQIFIDLVGQQMMPTVEAGDVEVLLQWLDWGLVANTVGNLHWSLLHHSSARGQINIASLLLERGANVNILDSNKSTPLHSACFHGHKRIAELLLGRGADINAKDQRGNTPLHSAVSGEHPEVINLLLENGCDTSIPNKEGQIFTHLVNEFLIDAVGKSRVAQVVSLLKGAADPNTKDTAGYPVLCSSTLKGDLLIVDALLEAGANPNICSEATQKTPLHYSCSISNLFIMKALLDKGASVASKDKYGCIPLHEAAKEGDKNLVTVLMGRGSSLNAQDMDGNTPLHIAARWGQSEVVEQLLESGAAEDIRNKNGMLYSDLALMRAVRTEDATQVMSGLAWGGNPNIQDSKGWTLLHHAVYKSAREVCFILLESEPNVNIADKNGRTPLLLAAYRGNTEIVEMLLNAGADINAKDLENRTPLHWAADEGSIETVELLLSRGASRNIKNKKGLLYSDLLLKHLYFAVRHNDEKKVESFLRAGADQTAELYGTEVTPIEEAKRRKYYSILKKMVAMKPAKAPPKSNKEEFIALEDVKRLFEDYEKEDDSSDESEDEDFDPDEDAYWKMHNAPVVLSAKELLEEEEKSFWDHWEEKPKVVSAEEFFKEKASWWETASSSSEEVSSSSSDEKDSDDDVPTFEELKKSWGKVVPAKDFFREDECWWRDAVEDLDKPKVILAKEYFKEKTAWWEQSSSDEEAKEIQEENSRPEENKIIPSKDLFPEDIPWWQTENSSEEESESEKKYLSSDNKANKSEEKSEEESSVYEDIEESLTEDWETANDSVMSDSSTTMYSVSDGEKIPASDLFVENPWWYNEDDQTDNSISEDKLSEDRSDRTETTEVAEEESFIDIDKYDGRTRILSSTDSDASTNIIIDALDSNSIENLLELDIDEDHQEHISAPQNDDKMFECSNKSKNHRNTANEDSVDLSEPIKTENEKCLPLQGLSNNPIEEPIICKSIISEKEENDKKTKYLNHNINNSRLELEKLEEPDSINESSEISSIEFNNKINENPMNNGNQYQKHCFDLNKTENPENVSNENEVKDLAPVVVSLSEQNDGNSFESKSNLCGSLKQSLGNDKAVFPTIFQGDKRLVKETEKEDKESYSNLSNKNMMTSNNLGKIADVGKNVQEAKTSSSCNFVIIPNIQKETDMLKEDENSQANLNGSNKFYSTSNFNFEKANELLDSLKKTDILELESNPSHSQHEKITPDTQLSLTHINLNNTNTNQNVNDSNKSANEKSSNPNPPVTNKMNACLARVDATLAWLDARMANDSLNATLSHKSSSLPCIPKPTFSKTPKNMIHESLERAHENDSTNQTNTNKSKENFSIFRLKIRINDQHAPQTFEHYTDKPEDDSCTFTRGFNSSKYSLHNSEGSLHKLKINGNSYTNSNKCNIKKCNSVAKLETTTRLQDYDLQKSNIMRTSEGNFTKIFKDFSRQPFLSDIFKSKYSQAPDVFTSERRHSVGSIISEGSKEELSKNQSHLLTNIKNKNSKNHRRHSFDETILKVKGVLNNISPFISNLKKNEKANKMMYIATSNKKADKEIIPDAQSVNDINKLNPPCHRKENETSDESNVSFYTCKETQDKKKSSNNFCDLISSSQPDQNESSRENTRTRTSEKNPDNFSSISITKPATLYSTTTKIATTTATRTATTTTTTISTTTTAATIITTTIATTTTTPSTTTNNSNNFNNSPNNSNINSNNSRSNCNSKDKSCYRIGSDTSKENLTMIEPLNTSGKGTDHLESTFHLSKMNDEKNILEISVSSDDKIISGPFQKCRPKPFECVKLPNDLNDGFCLENYVALSSENLDKKQESLEHLFPTNKCVTESNLRIKPPLPPRRNKDNRQMSNKNDSYDITKFPVENPRINDVNRLSCNLGKSESSEQDIQMADSLNGEKLSLPDEELHQIADNTHVEEVVPKPPLRKKRKEEVKRSSSCSIS